MSKRLVVAALAAVVLGGTASTAAAADAIVHPSTCAAQGGQATVPAGSTLVVRQGLAEQTRGNLTAFLNAQTTTLTINGGAPIDLSGGYESPTAAGGGYVSFVNYPTGMTLAAGQSATFAFTISLSHPVPEVFNPAAGGDAGEPVFNSGSTTVTCTVTAV
jgi:hypothetical protein